MSEGAPEKELLTAEEVARKLRVGKPTVHRLLKTGQLAGFKVSKRWRIRSVDLAAFMNGPRNNDA